jgi:hypothetical protein
MKRKIAVVAIAGLTLLGLTGCNSDNAGYQDEGFRVEVVATPSGSVTCVLYDGFDGDSISCDWENSR